jgi:hypothetical protein
VLQHSNSKEKLFHFEAVNFFSACLMFIFKFAFQLFSPLASVWLCEAILSTNINYFLRPTWQLFAAEVIGGIHKAR